MNLNPPDSINFLSADKEAEMGEKRNDIISLDQNQMNFPTLFMLRVGENPTN